MSFMKSLFVFAAIFAVSMCEILDSLIYRMDINNQCIPVFLTNTSSSESAFVSVQFSRPRFIVKPENLDLLKHRTSCMIGIIHSNEPFLTFPPLLDSVIILESYPRVLSPMTSNFESYPNLVSYWIRKRSSGKFFTYRSCHGSSSFELIDIYSSEKESFLTENWRPCSPPLRGRHLKVSCNEVCECSKK